MSAVLGNRSLTALFAGVMFISFVHQPLTIPLVYASPWRLATHKWLFLSFPMGAAVVITVATERHERIAPDHSTALIAAALPTAG